MEITFTIGGAFKEARGIVKANFWKIIRQYAAIIAVFMLVSMLAGNNLLLGFLVSSVFAFATTLFSLGYAKRGSYGFNEFMKAFSFQSFAYFFLAFLVSRVFMIAGTILLVIPGIIIAVTLGFVKFAAAEKEIGPWDACKESARITQGNRWKLFGFFVVAILFNILGIICLVVGVLYTFPVTLIATALIYRKLYDAKDFVPEIVEVIETETEVVEVPNEEVVEEAEVV